MRKFCGAILLLGFLSCGSSYSSKMTKLINEKRICEDSLQFYRERYNKYIYKMDILMMYHHGRNAKATADTAADATVNMSIFEIRIKGINFSIDSLSKMK